VGEGEGAGEGEGEGEGEGICDAGVLGEADGGEALGAPHPASTKTMSNDSAIR
jgi:hypothetical protein